MPKFLKGNYRLSKGKGTLNRHTGKKDLTQRFEEQALAKLGGSLCFVMKRGIFVWSDPDSPKHAFTREATG